MKRSPSAMGSVEPCGVGFVPRGVTVETTSASGNELYYVFVMRSITLDDRRHAPTPRRSCHRAGSATRRTARDAVVAKDR